MQGEDPDVGRMLAYCAGNDEALADLYRRWSAPLRRYLEWMVKEQATAEELMQESFVRVHRARNRYRPEARFSTWLFHIARNLALNELDRARRRKPHFEVPSDARFASATPLAQLASEEPSVAQVFETRETQERVAAALEQLPERQRTALWLCAVEGRSYVEIAEVLGTSTQSVKALVHRARSTLVAQVRRGN